MDAGVELKEIVTVESIWKITNCTFLGCLPILNLHTKMQTGSVEMKINLFLKILSFMLNVAKEY